MSIVAPIYKHSWYNGVIRERDDSAYTTKKPPTTRNKHNRNKHKLKLDQIMRVLFKLSKKVTLNMINRLFDENFTSEEVDVQYENSEFIQDDYGRITGDLFIKIRNNRQIYRYHIEFQTLNDSSMVIRMFRYGFEKAVELASTTNADQPIILEFPRQLVIFLEENKEIKNSLAIALRLPSGEVIPYAVPVMKYWRYTAEDLKEQKMYALLPLQVFKSRKKIEAIYRSQKTEAEKSRLITEQFAHLKDTIQQTVDILGQLHDQQEIHIGDLERILRVLRNINEYLYKRYGEYQTIEEEVHHMVKTLYDPRIMEKGIEKGKIEGIKKGKLEVAKRLLKKGVKVSEVSEVTDLSIEEILEQCP